jgi:archaellum component FlaC
LNKRKNGQVVKKIIEEPAQTEIVEVQQVEAFQNNLQDEINNFKNFHEELSGKVSTVSSQLNDLDKKLQNVIHNNK